MTLIINTVIDKGPIIFLRLAEGNVGETDAIIESSYNTEFTDISIQYVNLTQIDKLYPDKYGLSPRKEVYIDYYVPKTISLASISPETGLPTYVYVQRLTFDFTDGGSKKLITQDTEQEKSIKAGKGWSKSKLGLGECYIPSSFATSYELQEGSIIYLKFQYNNEMKILWDHFIVRNGITTTFKPSFVDPVVAPCKVAGTFSSSGGKVSTSDSSKTIFMEMEHYYEWLSPYTALQYSTTIMTEFRKFLKTEFARGYDFADYVVMNFPDPRINYYKDSDYDNVQQKVVSYTNNLVDDLGFFPESVN